MGLACGELIFLCGQADLEGNGQVCNAGDLSKQSQSAIDHIANLFDELDAILEDLVKTGYDGGISIEPHLAAVFHDPDAVGTDSDRSEELYVEYGKRLMAKLDALGAVYS